MQHLERKVKEKTEFEQREKHPNERKCVLHMRWMHNYSAAATDIVSYVIIIIIHKFMLCVDIRDYKSYGKCRKNGMFVVRYTYICTYKSICVGEITAFTNERKFRIITIEN